MLTLYGMYRSRASRNIWLLEELGAKYVLKPIIQAYRLPDPKAPDAPLNTLSPEFLKLSPAGAIPVMEDDGLILSESLAINHYIARKHGGPLAPADLREDAQMVQWALFAATWIETPALEIMMAYARKETGTKAGQAAVAALADKLLRPFGALEKHLSMHSHMVGGRFTAADIDMAEIVRYAQPHDALMQRFPRVKSWLELCQNRAAFKKMWTLREAEPA